MKYMERVNTDILALVLAGIILCLSLLPKSAIPGDPHNDVLHHLLAYTALTGAAIFRRQSLPGIFLILAAIVLYGGVIEIIQPMVGRVGSLRDFTINLAGASLGFVLTTVAKQVAKSV